MRVDLSSATALRVAGRDVAELRVAGRRVWPRPDPLLTRLAGVGYAGSIYQVTHGGAGRWQYDTGGGWADFAPAQTSGVLTTGLVQDGAAISWLRDDGVRSNASPRLWVPYAMPGLAGVFDIRRVSSGATSWPAAAGGMSYTQPNAAIRPVYEPTGLAGRPCFFNAGDRVWIINGLPPAPAERTLIGLFAFVATDPGNSLSQIYNSQAGAWGVVKSWINSGKRVLWITRTIGLNDAHGGDPAITDDAACIVSAKTKRPSGDHAFRVDGTPAGSGTSAVAAYVDNGGTYTMGGYIRLGSHAYVDAYMTLDDETKFEGWCAWTQGFVDLLSPGHPNKTAPPLAS